MKILPVAIKMTYSTNLIGTLNVAGVGKFSHSTSLNDSFEKKVGKQPVFNTVSFMGYNVHILDGGAHAENMKHFAQATSSDMDITMHEVKINPKAVHDKQMQSLYEQLKAIPPKRGSKAEYIALPGLCNVPLQDLEDQYQRVMGESIKLTPENVKANKKKILAFLKEISANPSANSTYIGYMDPNRQGMEWVHEVIQEINRCVKDGYKVYVPSSGHPEYQSLKWLAGERGRKPELQYYISNHKDIDGSVKSMRSYIQNQGWYDFNLLNLSDAHMINLKDKDGKDDYIYAAYDATVTDGERGVYNFYPVRDSGGKIKGYGYSDTYTVEYPYSEFPANDEIANVSKFVGRPIPEVRADEDKTKDFKDYLKGDYKGTSKDFADYLFKIDDVFTPSEISREKINLRGKYTDSSRKLFFDTNYSNQVIFPNCDCEGSGRPSVLSMWGSCFSVFNAIKKDIDYENRRSHVPVPLYVRLSYDNEVRKLLTDAEQAEKNSDNPYWFKVAEDHYNHAIELGKIENFKNAEPFIGLGNLHFKRGNNESASSCYNQAIDILSSEIIDSGNGLEDLKTSFNKYNNAKKAESDYTIAARQYNAKSSFYRIFNSPPAMPTSSRTYAAGAELYNVAQQIPELFENLSKICEKKGESYPARVCKAAAKERKDCSLKGTRVIEARAKGVQYVGDIFNEIKP